MSDLRMSISRNTDADVRFTLLKSSNYHMLTLLEANSRRIHGASKVACI